MWCEKHQAECVLDSSGPGQSWVCPACERESIARATRVEDFAAFVRSQRAALGGPSDVMADAVRRAYKP